MAEKENLVENVSEAHMVSADSLNRDEETKSVQAETSEQPNDVSPGNNLNMWDVENIEPAMVQHLACWITVGVFYNGIIILCGCGM